MLMYMKLIVEDVIYKRHLTPMEAGQERKRNRTSKKNRISEREQYNKKTI